MFDGRFKSEIERYVRPVGESLRRTGLSPDHFTVLGLCVAGAAAVAIGTGKMQLGLLLVICSALPDLLDGALAKASNSASQRGAFFDSVVDRVSDSLLFGGVAWFYASSNSPQFSIVPFAILGASLIISYERAKAESLGLYAKGGLMERAERIILLCFGLLFDSLLKWVMVVMLVLVVMTAVQRFVKVWKQAAVAPVTAEKQAIRRSRRASRRARRDDYRARFQRRRRLQ
jgi:CDP-diacylglycerol--glycerol-3-phosphate 3-phosphatidyltransferase